MSKHKLGKGDGMSVLARNRSLSKLEFYKNAVELRKKMCFLLLRDLGAKSQVRNIQVDAKNMEPEDAEAFLALVDKYGIGKCPDVYPSWIIEKLRDSIWDLLRDMMLHITRAYTIWATNLPEAYERRLSQDRAISCCESILKELELAIDILPIDAEKYMVYVDCIEREIALLKGWRKSDNKRIADLKTKK